MFLYNPHVDHIYSTLNKSIYFALKENGLSYYESILHCRKLRINQYPDNLGNKTFLNQTFF